MITKQILKEEIDHVRDEHLEALYNIIRAFGLPIGQEAHIQEAEKSSEDIAEAADWHTFIQETYGCLADDPIERGDQGDYDVREVIE